MPRASRPPRLAECDSGESPNPFPILTFCLWDQRDDEQEEQEQKEDDDMNEDREEEEKSSSSESETEGADLSHVSTGSESDVVPSPLFLKCKPSVKRKADKESEDEDKRTEQDQQTDLTLESLGNMMAEAEVIHFQLLLCLLLLEMLQELRGEVEQLENKVKELQETGSAQV